MVCAVPTLPNGDPAPPPNPPPGGGNWKWFPDPRRWNPDKQRWDGNKRGGTWGPEKWNTKDGPRPTASWDDNPGKDGKGHWDIDDGQGNSWKEDEDGNRITDEEAHGRAPQPPAPEPSLFSAAGDWVWNHKGEIGTVALGAGLVVGAIIAPEIVIPAAAAYEAAQ